MPKTKEELEQLKKQFEELKKESKELSEEELNSVTGGCGEDEVVPPKYSVGYKYKVDGTSNNYIVDYTVYTVTGVDENSGPDYLYNVLVKYTAINVTQSETTQNEWEGTKRQSDIDQRR